MGVSTVRTLVGATLLLLLAPRAIAEPPASRAADANVVEEAKEHFDEGQALYLRGQYDEASIEFLAAHDAKPFPAFLYNAAVSDERARRYGKALDLYRQYLAESGPTARDHAAVTARITALEQTVASTPAPTVAPTGVASVAPGKAGSASQPTSVEIVRAPVAAATAALPAPEIKGIVMVESEPPGATVWLDGKQGAPLGQTPWEGSIDKGHHTVLIEHEGFKPERKEIDPSSDRMIDLYFALSKEHFLGWVQVTGNVPGAEVYVDDKSAGPVGRAPFSGFFKPGTHHVIVASRGYEDFKTDVTVASGQPSEVHYALSPWGYGLLSVTGPPDEGTAVYMDGSELCAVPCKTKLDPGIHRLTVAGDGMKDLDATVDARPGSEEDLAVHLRPTPSRIDAYVSFVIAAGFATGGVYVGKLAQADESALRRDETASPPLSSTDPRFNHGMYEAIGADALYGLAGLTAGLGIYYLFRDAGPASTGDLRTRQIAIVPSAGPGNAAIDLTGSF